VQGEQCERGELAGFARGDFDAEHPQRDVGRGTLPNGPRLTPVHPARQRREGVVERLGAV
jgi:hypothetical protein